MTYTTWTFCKSAGCMTKHKADHWNNSKADKAGWFHSKSGEAWCPEHVPEWVPAWRAEQAKKKRLKLEARAAEIGYDARAAQDI